MPRFTHINHTIFSHALTVPKNEVSVLSIWIFDRSLPNHLRTSLLPRSRGSDVCSTLRPSTCRHAHAYGNASQRDADAWNGSTRYARHGPSSTRFGLCLAIFLQGRSIANVVQQKSYYRRHFLIFVLSFITFFNTPPCVGMMMGAPPRGPPGMPMGFPPRG